MKNDILQKSTILLRQPADRRGVKLVDVETAADLPGRQRADRFDVFHEPLEGEGQIQSAEWVERATPSRADALGRRGDVPRRDLAEYNRWVLTWWRSVRQGHARPNDPDYCWGARTSSRRKKNANRTAAPSGG